MYINDYNRFSEEDIKKSTSTNFKDVSKIRNVKKENEFLDFLSIKLFGSINKIGKHIGGGLFGDVYEIDKFKAIKIAPYYGKNDSQFAFNNYLKHHNNPNCVKVYSNGLILVSNRFKDRLKEKLVESDFFEIDKLKNVSNFSKTLINFLENISFGGGFFKFIGMLIKARIMLNNTIQRKYDGIKSMLDIPYKSMVNLYDTSNLSKSYVQYTIMERLHIPKNLQKELMALGLIINIANPEGLILGIDFRQLPLKYLSNDVVLNNTINLIKKRSYLLSKNETLRYTNLCYELSTLIKNIEILVKWTDVNYGSFGYNKKGELVAVDIDGEFENSSKYSEVLTIIRENKF